MRFLHSLQWRIVLAYTALIVISMGLVSLYLIGFVRSTYISNLEERLENEAGLVGEIASYYLQNQLGSEELAEASERLGVVTDARITILDLDGTVLADTWEAPELMENHALRPEVRDALNTGLGKDTRVSSTVGVEMLYIAAPIRVDDTLMGVARVAMPTSVIQSNVNRIIATISLSAVIVTALSLALGYYLAHRTSRSVRSVAEAAGRLAAGDMEHRVEALSQDETRELAEAFNSMATSLRTNIQALSGERDKLSAVLETMGDGVVVIGSEDQVELFNTAGEALLGVGGPPSEGARFMEFVRDYELQRLVSLCQETKQRQYGEVELLQRGRFLSCIATPLSGDGSPGVLLTLHDLTRIRQVETTRREFVSNVSHELRTPLAAVRVMAETLESGALEEKDVARDFVRRIQGEVDRMNSMVEDLLELARLEGGQDTLSLAPVDLVSLMEGARSQFQAQAEAKSIKVEVNAPEGLPGVLGDEEKLRQVLSNLLENALKFTWVEGEITLSAHAEAGFVTVNVSDNGVGIPEEHLPHIFERFYKVDRSRRDGGTGLGLAIVKHIVQSHGGEAWVESRASGGSSFSFRIPAAT